MRSELFAYDPIGNRVLDKNGNYVYDASSQRLKEDYQYFYNFDNNGNLISKIAKDVAADSYAYAYSSMNQLTSVKITQGISGPVKKEIQYNYDVLGRRMRRVVIDNQNSVNSNIRNFVNNGDNVFAEYDGSGNLLAQYTHSPLRADDILDAHVTSSGVTAGLAKSSGSYFYLKDALGSVTDVSDANGNIVQKYEYSAFGKIVGIHDGSGNDISTAPNLNTSFTFTGREWDQDAGIYYYRARYYDPNVGRFLQQDPEPGNIQNPITTNNKYAYAGNGPANHVDPTGRDFWDFLIGVAVVALAVYTGGAAAAFIGGAVGSGVGAGALGAVLGAVAGVASGAIVGGITGAAIGAISDTWLGRDAADGASKFGLLGAVAGGVSGGINGYIAGNEGASVDNWAWKQMRDGVNGAYKNFRKDLQAFELHPFNNKWTAEFIKSLLNPAPVPSIDRAPFTRGF